MVERQASKICSAVSKTEIFTTDLFLFDMAEQYGAAVFTLQHRYYGWNQTYSLNETDALKWLTTE